MKMKEERFCEYLENCDSGRDLLYKMGFAINNCDKNEIYTFIQKRLDALTRSRYQYTLSYCTFYKKGTVLLKISNTLLKSSIQDKEVWVRYYIEREIEHLSLVVKSIKEMQQTEIQEKLEKKREDQIYEEIDIEDPKEIVRKEIEEQLKKKREDLTRCKKGDPYLFHLIAEIMISILKNDLFGDILSKKKKTDKKAETYKKFNEYLSEDYVFVCKPSDYKLLEKELLEEALLEENSNKQKNKIRKEIIEWKELSKEAINSKEGSYQLLKDRCEKIAKNYSHKYSICVINEKKVNSIDIEFLSKIICMFQTDEDLYNLQENNWEKFSLDDRKELFDIIRSLDKTKLWEKIEGEEIEGEEAKRKREEEEWLDDLKINMFYPNYCKAKECLLHIKEIKECDPASEKYLCDIEKEIDEFFNIRERENSKKTVLERLKEKIDSIEIKECEPAIERYLCDIEKEIDEFLNILERKNSKKTVLERLKEKIDSINKLANILGDEDDDKQLLLHDEKNDSPEKNVIQYLNDGSRRISNYHDELLEFVIPTSTINLEINQALKKSGELTRLIEEQSQKRKKFSVD